MSTTMDAKFKKDPPLARMVLGAALALTAVILSLFFDTGGTGGPEGPLYENGLAGLAFPLLVIGAVLLFSWLPARAIRREGDQGSANQCWRAASGAIHFWALSMATISIVLTLFLGSASDAMGWTGAIDGDFPRVVINDFQENSSCALILLVLYYGLCRSYLRHRAKL